MSKNKNQEYNISIDMNLYSKEAILETSYRFTNNYYIKLNVKKNICIVRMISKKQIDNDINIIGTFNNELIDQQIRNNIKKETKEIRRIVIKKAFFPFEIKDDENRKI